MDKENKTEALRLPTGENLVLSSSPHLSAGASLPKIMGGVLLALLPAVAASVWFFGWRALFIIVYTTFCCVAAEAIWCRMAGKPARKTVSDCSAAVTGVLLALCLPVGVPLYVPPIGAILAIWLGKQVYGGLGNNPFNPALVARVGLLIALPAVMTTWRPSRGMRSENYPQRDLFMQSADAVTCATPLGVVGTKPKILGRGVFAEDNFYHEEDPELLRRSNMSIIRNSHCKKNTAYSKSN